MTDWTNSELKKGKESDNFLKYEKKKKIVIFEWKRTFTKLNDFETKSCFVRH